MSKKIRNADIRFEENKIIISGDVSPGNVRHFLSIVHSIVSEKSFHEVEIDFSDVRSIFESFMIPIIAICNQYISDGVSFKLKEPRDSHLKSLFLNANWAHLICPSEYPASKYLSPQHVPALQFLDATAQGGVVDRIMDSIIGGLGDLNRGHVKSIYWALNEITDNVLNHSLSPVGGFVQSSTFQQNNSVEFIVADAGIGIPQSLNITDPCQALERAIQEGVTRNKKTNAGNGLFGTYRIATISNGQFEIQSSYGSLFYSNKTGTKTKKNISPYAGTYIRCSINCSNQNLLEQALRFNDKPHDPPFDYIERAFENGHNDDFYFIMKDVQNSFGSREAGKSIRNKLLLLIKESGANKVVVDFNGVFIVSSSFADEVFGRIFVDMGPISFMRKVKIINCDETILKLIDRAIIQRTSSG